MTLIRELDTYFTGSADLDTYLKPLPATGVARRYAALSAAAPLGSKVNTLPNLGSFAGSLAATSAAPTLLEEAGIQYVQFDGFGDAMQCAVSDSAIGTAPFSVYFVGRIRSYPPTANWTLASAGGTSGNGGMFVTTTKVVSVYRGSTLGTTVDPTNAWHVFIAVFNGASTVVRVDSSETTGTTGTNAPSLFTLGLDATGAATARTDMIETGLINRALTGPEREDITNQLRAFYGF